MPTNPDDFDLASVIDAIAGFGLPRAGFGFRLVLFGKGPYIVRWNASHVFYANEFRFGNCGNFENAGIAKNISEKFCHFLPSQKPVSIRVNRVSLGIVLGGTVGTNLALVPMASRHDDFIRVELDQLARAYRDHFLSVEVVDLAEFRSSVHDSIGGGFLACQHEHFLAFRLVEWVDAIGIGVEGSEANSTGSHQRLQFWVQHVHLPLIIGIETGTTIVLGRGTATNEGSRPVSGSATNQFRLFNGGFDFHPGFARSFNRVFGRDSFRSRSGFGRNFFNRRSFFVVVAEFRIRNQERCRSANLADPRIGFPSANDDDDLASVGGSFLAGHSFANWKRPVIGGFNLGNLPGFNKETCAASFWLDADVLAAYSNLQEATFQAGNKNDLPWGTWCSCHCRELSSNLGFRSPIRDVRVSDSSSTRKRKRHQSGWLGTGRERAADPFLNRLPIILAH